MPNIVADDNRCERGVHAFPDEDSEECACGAMRADGTYKQCAVLHDENRCPPSCDHPLTREDV